MNRRYPGGYHWLRKNFADQYNPKSPDEVQYAMINTWQDIEVFRNAFDYGTIAVDTETTGLHWGEDEPVGICLCFDKDFSFYLPLDHKTNVNDNASQEVVDECIDILNRSEQLIFFNSRFDVNFLKKIGLEERWDHFYDAQVLIYNFDLSFGKYLSLKTVIKQVFGWDEEEIDPERIPLYPPKMVRDYACLDSYATYQIWDYFKHYYDIINEPNRIDHRLLPILYKMETNPIKVDTNYLYDQQAELEPKVEKLEQQAKNQLDNQNINIDSEDQLRQEFEKRGIDTGVETKKGKMSVSKEGLKEIQDECEAASTLLDYRKFNKIKNDEIDKMIGVYDKDISGVRFAYRNCKTATSRLSSGGSSGGYFGGVNAQNFLKPDKKKYKLKPSNDPDIFCFSIEEEEENHDFKAQTDQYNIRYSMVPDPGYLWVSIDYSSQEIRLAGNLSKERQMIEPFVGEAVDFHSKTLENVLKPFEPEDRDFDRGDAKKVNYSVFYGGTLHTIQNALDVSKEIAEKIYDEFWSQYSLLTEWSKDQWRRTKRQGYVDNYFNRRRWVKNLVQSSQDWKKDKAKRISINHPIQSMGADIFKLGLIKTWNNVVQKYGEDVVFPILNLHDEINFQVKSDDTDRFVDVCLDLIENMELEISNWEVPFEVDIDIGPSFGGVIPCDVENNTILLAGEHDIREL